MNRIMKLNCLWAAAVCVCLALVSCYRVTLYDSVGNPAAQVERLGLWDLNASAWTRTRGVRITSDSRLITFPFEQITSATVEVLQSPGVQEAIPDIVAAASPATAPIEIPSPSLPEAVANPPDDEEPTADTMPAEATPTPTPLPLTDSEVSALELPPPPRLPSSS